MSKTNEHTHRVDIIDSVRESSRRLVRSWGFLQSTVANTGLSPSAAHTLIEIEKAGSLTASEISAILLLEKSTVSRMLTRLVRDGLIRESASTADARSKLLTLTAKGNRTLSALHEFSRDQVQDAFNELTAEEQQTVKRGLALYAKALSAASKEAFNNDE